LIVNTGPEVPPDVKSAIGGPAISTVGFQAALKGAAEKFMAVKLTKQTIHLETFFTRSSI
jgi:hypothetical protein